MSTQCICKICDCGLHSCPRTYDKTPFHGCSAHQHDYPAHKVEIRPKREPQKYVPNPAKFDPSTTMTENFKQWEMPARNSFRPEVKARTPVPFLGENSHKTDYPAHEVQPRKKREAQKYVPNTAKFDGSTTATENFKKWAVPKREAIKPQISQRSKVPFSGESGYRRDYPAHEIEPMKQREPQKYVPSTAAFNSETESGCSFKKWSSPKRESFQPKLAERPKIPFDGQSSHHHDFPAHQVEPRKQRAAQKYVPSTHTFNSETENKASFQAWKPERQAPFAPKVSQRSKVPFDGTTTNQSTFVAHQVERRKKAEPAKYVPNTARFDDTTSSREAFKQWEVKRELPIRPHTSNRKQIPFTATTSSREDFKAHPLEALPPQKRTMEYKRTPDNRDFMTQNRMAHDPKEVHVCPAAALVSRSPSKAERPTAWKDKHVFYDTNTKSWA